MPPNFKVETDAIIVHEKLYSIKLRLKSRAKINAHVSKKK